MAKSDSKALSKAMIKWYEQHGRKNLPWQLDNSPYHTWLSEIMLQQTQVKTVIPYYHNFTERFSDIDTLAEASLDEVLHLWTGLGYYSRARNLHKCAGIISEEYQGSLPDNINALVALPGIGRSTAGAILSLSMNQPAPILDGNVKRVFSRCFCVDGWSGESKVQKKLWQIADEQLPHKDFKAYNQSLMDLGANVCKRSKPLCEQCPLTSQCLSYQNQVQHLYPQGKPKKTLPQKQCYMLIVKNKKGEVYLEQRPPQGLWGGLWSFPEFDNPEDIDDFCQTHALKIHEKQPLDGLKHSFTHFQLFIHPVLCTIRQEPAKISESQSLWYKPEQHQIGLPTPIKKLIERVQQ